MKIRLVSDLHMEFSDYQITNPDNADVLVLAGDIMLAQDLHDHPANTIPSWEDFQELGARQQRAVTYRNLIRDASQQFTHVVAIAGNHEFYKGNFYAGLEYLKYEYSLYPNVHFLEDESITLDGIKFIGATLWTDMNKADAFTLWYIRTALNDFSTIRNDLAGYRKLEPNDVLQRHRQSIKYITTELEKVTAEPVVMVTHHLPTLQSIPPRFAAMKDMNGGYASDLSDLILDNPCINLWLHGHTHDPCDYMVGDTRVVCNPRGYVSARQIENPDWDEFKIIEV